MSVFNSEDSTSSRLDRVRSSTAAHVNEEIDHQTDLNIQRYKGKSKTEILERIKILDKEWDVERVLEVNASTGWCPPLPLLRRLGIRTRGEIDREKYALRAPLE
jgi:hypothetical protein